MKNLLACLKVTLRLVVMIVVFTLLIACTRGVKFSQLKDGKDGTSCTVVNKTPAGATILCTDGSSVDITNGSNGLDGVDGSNGILKVVDPCGPSATTPDEILIVLNDFTVIAWYQSLGLSVLEPHIEYRTTDHQKCKFKVDEFGNVIEL